MSHFDDLPDFGFIAFNEGSDSGGVGCIFGLLFLAIVGGMFYWAYNADNESKKLCEQHGEKYVDSRSAYTLCEKADGTVVRR